MIRNKVSQRNSSVVHWLRFLTSTAGGTGLIPSWGKSLPVLRLKEKEVRYLRII